MAPSGPAAMLGPLSGAANSVMMPAGVIRPIVPANWRNQRLPSGPAVMLLPSLLAVGSVNSAMAPSVVIRPILFVAVSVNQSAPSGPAAMPPGRLLGVGTGNSSMVWAETIAG